MIIVDVLKFQGIDNLTSYKSINLPGMSIVNVWHLFGKMCINIYLRYDLFDIVKIAWVSSWQYFRGFFFFAGKVFQQTVGIPMGTNCAPFLDNIFLYSYEADFIQALLSTGKKQHLCSIQITGISMMYCP